MIIYLDIQEAFTKRAESCILIGRADIGGVPTWGWGHTGPEVRVGQNITDEQAEIDFRRDQATADAEVKAHVPPDQFSVLQEHEKAALLDFCFNAGAGPELGHPDEWTIWQDVRAGKLAAVPDQLNRFVYVHVDGKPVTSRGLKNRRTAEVVLWNTADVDASVATANAGGATASSGAVRVLPTPPRALPPKALSGTSLGLKVGGVCSAAAAACVNALPSLQDKAQQAHDLAAAHADNHYVAAAASTLSAVVVCIGVAALFVSHHQDQKAQV